MNKQYVAVAAVVLGLVATPAIASAVGNQQEPNQSVDRVDQGWMNEMHDSVWGPDGVRPGYEWMTEMHDSVWGPDGVRPGYEWMTEMHDSVWGPDGVRPGYEWMTEMHDSMWNGDTNAGYGSMMGGSTSGSSSSQHFNGTRMGAGS